MTEPLSLQDAGAQLSAVAADLAAALADEESALLAPVDPDEADDDLLRYVTQVLASFWARLRGRRSALSRAGRLRRPAGDASPTRPWAAR